MKRDEEILGFAVRILCRNLCGTMQFTQRQALAKLVKLAGSIHRHHEARCNRETSEAEEKRYKMNRVTAEGFAHSIGMDLYVQTDPRGAPLYLLPLGSSREEMARTYPTDGIMVPW
jgi:hypothetical protein